MTNDECRMTNGKSGLHVCHSSFGIRHSSFFLLS
jgi:hypothetical protein